MSNFGKVWLLGLCAAFAMFSLFSANAADKELQVSRIHIYKKVDSKGFDDWVRETLNNPTTEAIVVIVAGYFGVSPEQIETAKLVLNETHVKSDTSWSWQIAAGPGYTICNAFVSEVRSHIGRGAISVKHDEGFLNFYASLWQRPFGQGRSSVSLMIEVASAPSNRIAKMRSEGTCLPKGGIVYEAQWKKSGAALQIRRRSFGDEVTTQDLPPM